MEGGTHIPHEYIPNHNGVRCAVQSSSRSIGTYDIHAKGTTHNDRHANCNKNEQCKSIQNIARHAWKGNKKNDCFSLLQWGGGPPQKVVNNELSNFSNMVRKETLI